MFRERGLHERCVAHAGGSGLVDGGGFRRRGGSRCGGGDLRGNRCRVRHSGRAGSIKRSMAHASGEQRGI